MAIPKGTQTVDPLNLPPAKNEAEMTEEQVQIAKLKHQLAVEVGRKAGTDVDKPEFEEPPETLSDSSVDDESRVLIHFVEDGFTFSGTVWYRGQEVEFVKGSRAYEDTMDRNGDTFLTLLSDRDQMERYGKVFFRPGPWPGKTLRAVKKTDFAALKDSKPVTDDDIDKAARVEEKRRRAAPVLPLS